MLSSSENLAPLVCRALVKILAKERKSCLVVREQESKILIFALSSA